MPSKKASPKAAVLDHRPVNWAGSAKDDISAFALPVKREIGFKLRKLQESEFDEDIVPLSGNDQFKKGKLVEIKADYNTDTYRAVVAIKFIEGIYVLHAFKKKSTSGKAIPKPDLKTIEKRLKAVMLQRQKEGLP